MSHYEKFFEMERPISRDVYARRVKSSRDAESDYADAVKKLEDVQAAFDLIDSGLRWSNTPQGFEYWCAVHKNLKGLIEDTKKVRAERQRIGAERAAEKERARVREEELRKKREAVEKMWISPRRLNEALYAIDAMATWSATPQGHTYWSEVKKNLKSLETMHREVQEAR